jgi:hypothetical protein
VGDDRERAAVSKGRSPHRLWMDAYEWAYTHAATIGTRPCPRCGARSLRLIFVVDQLDSESGTAVFWCDACLHGLIPLRAPVAENGRRVLRGTECVPNYTLIIEE